MVRKYWFRDMTVVGSLLRSVASLAIDGDYVYSTRSEFPLTEWALSSFRQLLATPM